MKSIFSGLSEKLKELNAIRAEYAKRHDQEVSPGKKKAKAKSKSEDVQILRLEIATSTIVKILLIVFLLGFLQQIIAELQTVLIIAAFSFFLSMGLAPFVNKLESYKIPRPLAILFLYMAFLGAIGLVFAKVLPIIAEQLLSISYDLRALILNGKIEEYPWLIQILEDLNFDPAELQRIVAQSIASLADNLQGIAGSTLSVLMNVFQGFFNMVFALVLMFFILLEREKIGDFVLLLFPSKNRDYVENKFQSVQNKMSEWFKGQFILMVCMGTFMYVGMKIFEYFFGMKYAFTIGLLAGVMELFPYIGVLLTGLLCLVVAINISWVLAVAVLVWIGLAQFLEGNFLVPVVMEKVVGLSSVVVMLAVSAGGILGAAFGGVPLAILFMIFAVPVSASVAIFVEEYVKREG
jgi:predicted PurR-regulated permease PerM